MVAADSPIKSVDDLLAQFKADPGSVSWGGFALGSPDHILCALIVKAGGGDVAKMNYIVAGAGGEMLAQVMGGHLTVATGGLNEMAQQIQTGKLRAIGISSPERLPGVDIPTFKEQGVDVDAGQLARPDGAGKDAQRRPRRRSTRRWERWCKSDEWQALLKERGWVDMYQPAEEFCGLPGAGADADRRHPAGCRADPVSRAGEDGRGMTSGWGLRIGEAVLGGVVLGLGLFIAIETSLMEVAPPTPRSARACSRS